MTRGFAVAVVIALILLGAADLFRRAANAQDGLASAEAQVGALAPEAAEAEFRNVERSLGVAGRIPLVGSALTGDLRIRRAAAAYWRSDYSLLPEDLTRLSGEGTSADEVFLAANAAYRRALARPTLEATIKDLDAVIAAYALVLKKSPGHFDAAYNYEYGVRFRNTLSQRGFANPPGQNGPGRGSRTENTHGEKGSSPPPKKADDSNVIVPLRPDERTNSQRKGGVTPHPIHKG